MGKGQYVSKNGNRYDNIHDCKAADIEYYQREEQNRLLKEQNEELKKQRQEIENRNDFVKNQTLHNQNDT